MNKSSAHEKVLDGGLFFYFWKKAFRPELTRLLVSFTSAVQQALAFIQRSTMVTSRLKYLPASFCLTEYVFRRTRERHYNFFDNYFSYLIDDDKKRLSDIGIKINPPPFIKPLFSYPSFIKTLSIRRLKLHTDNSINDVKNLELDLIVDNEAYFAIIMRYCDKIKFLYLYNIHQNNFNRLNELITHFSKSLRYLSIKNDIFCFGNRTTISIISMILKVLGQMLPDSLEYLNLYFTLQPNDLKVFLDNCRHVVLKKLLIKNNAKDLIDETFSILKEFVERKKVKYFAYKLGCIYKQDDLEYINFENMIKLSREVQNEEV
ncbi:9005_t:CDS:2 [Funneliformis geosporum]|nr:9005_t:CDS:2 [Funneliformis geosporum]